MKRRFLVAGMLWAVVAGRAPAEDSLPDRVRQLVGQGTPQVVEWRRDFHAHPELGNREERTSRVVAEALRKMGIEDVKTGVAHHGVVALIRGRSAGGRSAGPTVALRADMDALPIQEKNDLPFASQNPGAMHACGHDAHTAMLLGAAAVLVQLRDHLPGTVKLIFQPAEEGSPRGERGGAELMIDEGVLDDPKVSAIFGLRVNPEMDAGQIGYRPGVMMAGVDRFHATITGRQSHAALPWQGSDPVVAAAHVITALQTIPSHRIDARQPVVVSVGIVRAGTAWNIIPGQVTLEGTMRTHDPEARRKAGEEFRRIVTQTAAAMGAQAEIALDQYAPMLRNDPDLVARMKPALLRAVGREGAVETPPMMGGEDFALYSEKVPGMFCFLGVRNPAVGAVHALHTPEMRIDEAALPAGVRTLVLLAIDYLNGAEK